MDGERIKKLRERMRPIPFGNSAFQNRHFTAGAEGPERRYRHCLLQLNQKLNALQECEFRRRRIDIDIREIEGKLKTAEGFALERLLIDLEEKQVGLENEIKFIEDAAIEIAVYEAEIAGMPDFTREEFEAGEHQYWTKRLLGDAQRELLGAGFVTPGTMASLQAIGIVGVVLNDGVLTYHTDGGEVLLLEQ